MTTNVTDHPTELSPKAFRDQLKALRSTAPTEWDASRHLVTDERLATTLDRLADRITTRDELGALRSSLGEALADGPDGPALEELKTLTGLPTTKALRALCVYCGLTNEQEHPATPTAQVTDATLARIVTGTSPFACLLESAAPSVIDLGAGDLSFVDALANDLLPPLRATQRHLTVHAVDRVDPQSSLGTAYQAPPERVARLQQTPDLAFRYWSSLDMFALSAANRPKSFLPRYDVATCWAPANPTFAYEPTRLSSDIIRRDLEQSRGRSSTVTVDGEPALAVEHRGRELLFPAWKFDIRGPLALVDLLDRTAALGVLGAVDDAVFWELIGQLIEEPRARTRDVVLTAETTPTLFGSLFERLTQLPIGQIVSLADLTPLRTTIPRVLPTTATHPPRSAAIAIRHVTIRRGAFFHEAPASLTAQRFSGMSEEPPPWCLTLAF
ncbi:MAG: hypothetical protein U0172_09890 [Nitrospiraceae bacterium]